MSEIQENLKSINLNWVKLYIICVGVWPILQKMNLKCRKILNLETLNPDSAANSALYTSKSCYLQ